MVSQWRLPGVLLQVLLSGLLYSSCWGMQPDEEERSVKEAAADLAPRIAKALHDQPRSADRPLEVAVLAFGDQEGKVAEDLFFASKTLQGELTAELRNLGAGKFLVWDPSRLKKKAAETAADVKKLSVQDFKAAAVELKKLGLDAAVVGSYQVVENNRFPPRTNVHADILLADGPPLQAAAKAGTLESPMAGSSDGISTRFSVDVLVDDKPLPMYVEFQRGFGGVRRICLDLDRQTHYGKPFTIRLQNHGMPPAGWIQRTEKLERARFFCVAVFVDGVNSIYEKGPDGEPHPSQRHPDNVTQWVLTAPGVVALPGYDTAGDMSEQKSVRGPGGSLVDIQGFQINDKTAALFEFSDAGESHAHDVGLTKDIGLISVYFYSEQLRDDKEWFPPDVRPDGIGTRLGRSVPHDVFHVRVRTHKEPVEIWNIYYRYAGDNGSVEALRRAGQNIVPIEEAQADMKRRLREQDREFGNVFRARREFDRELEQMRQADGFGSPE